MIKNAPIFYREESPSPEISHFVYSFWEFKVDEQIPASLSHEVFPDGCLSIVFYQNKKTLHREFFINELYPKSIYVPVNAGDLMWGMRILPEAVGKFFDNNPAEMKLQQVGAESLGARFSPALENRLVECENFADAVAVYENYAAEFRCAARRN